MPVSRFRRTKPNQDVSVIGRGWVLPYWLERQTDPASDAYVGGDDDTVNVTGRNWTLIGAVGADDVGGVDPRGLVVTRPNAWSIDWWIRSEKRWHFPSREPHVSQRCIEDAPVIETSMRVPGGRIEHRAYAVGGANDAVVVEITNSTPVPVAVSIAVRPYGLTSLAHIERIELAENVVSVNGEPALILPRLPGRTAASDLVRGDCSLMLIDGSDEVSLGQPVTCAGGLAQAAFTFPLVHSGVLRVVLPFPVAAQDQRSSQSRHRSGKTHAITKQPEASSDISADRVASGWRAHVEHGTRFVLPDGPITSTFEQAKRSLHLFRHGADVVGEPLSRPGSNWLDAASIVGAMDRMGWHREVGEVIAAMPGRQLASGEIDGRRDQADGTGAALAIVGDHLRLSGATEVATVVSPMVAAAARFIEQQRRTKGTGDSLTRGLVPVSDHGGHGEFRYADNFWALKGLVEAAETLHAAGELDAATATACIAAELKSDLVASLVGAAARFGGDAVPATPHRRVDELAIDALVAVWPTRMLGAEHRLMQATADVVRERFLFDDAHHSTFGTRGLGVHRTARLAMVELMVSDVRALDRLRWLVRVVSPTGSWPETVHPRLGTGSGGEGHHGVATADFVTLIRSLLVHETVGEKTELALLSLMPPEWHGQAIEVHDAPTALGRLSFAVRWHGKCPALLWELDPMHERTQHSENPVTLTAPGLDPTWSTCEPRGEALLRQSW